MTIPKYRGAAAMLLLALVNPINAQDIDALSEVRKCAAINDADSRFACYEALGSRVTAAEARHADPAAQEPATLAPQAVDTVAPAASAVAVAAVTNEPEPKPESQPASESAQAAPATLPEDIGGEGFEEEVEQPEPEEASGSITSCQKGPDKKWYFVFASGQVWKQVDSKRLRFDDCNISATIAKDLFGYKMSVKGRADKIRVSRRK